MYIPIKKAMGLAPSVGETGRGCDRGVSVERLGANPTPGAGF
jgi:hypothetical protein